MSGQRRKFRGRRRWTAAEIATLRRLYANTLTATIARRLQRSVHSIYGAANILGLEKSEKFFASGAAGRFKKFSRACAAFRFREGHVPWNQGMTGWTAGGRSVRTRFAPGHRPHTWRPVGAYRVNGDGYLDRKVSDTGYPPHDWVGVHRLVWERHHGPIPPGHIVVFRPGRRTTHIDGITIDALELITRAENMQRNTRHRLPKPLADLIALRGALNRRLNKLHRS